MKYKKNLGRVGEETAANWLVLAGHRIITRNYHSPLGEVDIISQIGDYICFCEVKTRRHGFKDEGLAAITTSKMRKIIATAYFYLQEFDCPLQPRFDVILIEEGKNGLLENVTYLSGAFDENSL